MVTKKKVAKADKAAKNKNESKLFKEHLTVRLKIINDILEKHKLNGLVISSGTEHTYFHDDRTAPFYPNPHFVHYCPAEGPYHLLHFSKGKEPVLYYYHPDDFWHDHSDAADKFWYSSFKTVHVAELSQRFKQFPAVKNHAFIGNEDPSTLPKGLSANPQALLYEMDWERGIKTPYEIHCLKVANEMGAKAHKAALSSFKKGGSEIAIHQAYMKALNCLEEDLPYQNIIGIDEKSAILHYRAKRNVTGNVMLIDAGARYNYYGSDITRTYTTPKAPGEFKALLKAMEKLQQELCSLVRPGISFLELHHETHTRISQLLLDHELIIKSSFDEVMVKGFSAKFMPHGLGHMLGIQVHDVSGQQMNEKGDPCPKDSRYPKLRTLRKLRINEVITIEPGFYFIPMLLNQLRADEKVKKLFNWKLIDKLTPCGGIRIEDDVFTQKGGSLNLTRLYLP